MPDGYVSGTDLILFQCLFVAQDAAPLGSAGLGVSQWLLVSVDMGSASSKATSTVLG